MGISPLLPTAGEWMVYSDSLNSLDIVVLDARDESTVSTYQKTGFTVPNHFTIATAVGPASTVALAANIQRKYAVLINDSANPIYLNFTGPAVVNTGIRLNAAGGSYEMMPGNVWRGAINMISAVAADVLLVTEGV